MPVTKEAIEARSLQLQRQAEKLQNDLNATLGALQDCNYWMAQLKAESDNQDSQSKETA